MERLIRDQHKGDLRLDWRPEGLVCEIIPRYRMGDAAHKGRD
jgi:hypothetical protein